MKIHVLHTGEVRVSPYLPFGGDHCKFAQGVGHDHAQEGLDLVAGELLPD